MILVPLPLLHYLINYIYINLPFYFVSNLLLFNAPHLAWVSVPFKSAFRAVRWGHVENVTEGSDAAFGRCGLF